MANGDNEARPSAIARRVALVLGAGGPLGHAFHTGVLRALAEACDFQANRAGLVVGTSAGAQVGALLRAGMSPLDLWARASGLPLSAAGQAIARHYTRPSHRHPDPAAARRLRPAAPGYLLQAMRRPWDTRPMRLLSALLPAGRVSLHKQADGLRRLYRGGWSERPLWITALQLESGATVVFGKHGAPAVDVGTAVACSGSVPGVCQPVDVDGQRYVDGGMVSATHLDALGDQDCELVLVSSPLSMFGVMRSALRAEIRRLERTGARIETFQPGPRSLRALGRNPMVLARSRVVARVAFDETLKRLRHPAGDALRQQLQRLAPQ